MAESGVSDHVRCFCCDGGLRNWEVNDDPWALPVTSCKMQPEDSILVYMESPVVKAALETGIDRDLRRVIIKKVELTGMSYEDAKPLRVIRPRANVSVEDENRQLKEMRLCKICMDDEIGVNKGFHQSNILAQIPTIRKEKRN
uniref:Uncharacterized protein n=1 Tax=Strigamia maritima TaxID=126957 RepID=T1IQD4_STRMM